MTDEKKMEVPKWIQSVMTTICIVGLSLILFVVGVVANYLLWWATSPEYFVGLYAGCQAIITFLYVQGIIKFEDVTW